MWGLKSKGNINYLFFMRYFQHFKPLCDIFAYACFDFLNQLFLGFVPRFLSRQTLFDFIVFINFENIYNFLEFVYFLYHFCFNKKIFSISVFVQIIKISEQKKYLRTDRGNRHIWLLTSLQSKIIKMRKNTTTNNT